MFFFIWIKVYFYKICVKLSTKVGHNLGLDIRCFSPENMIPWIIFDFRTSEVADRT